MNKSLKYVVFVSLVMMGCVSQKKYDELLTERVQAEADLAECREALEKAREEITGLEEQVANLRSDTTTLGEELRTAENELSELKASYDKLETYYNNAISNSGKLNKDLAEQQQQLLLAKEENERLLADLGEREKRVEEMEAILKAQEEAVNKLKERIQAALLSFKGSDLSVEVKDGKVYVSLAEKLLFGSGSTVVDANGKKALQQLAQAIKDQADLGIMVEGHTDDVPISRTSKYMQDNWDLSVMRATSIVRILTDAGVEPNQITAAGKGEFYPVTTNESAEGRAKNRRTEIIITPDLSELFRLIEAGNSQE